MPLATENVVGGIFVWCEGIEVFHENAGWNTEILVSDFAGKEWAYCIAKLEFYSGLKYNITIIATGM